MWESDYQRGDGSRPDFNAYAMHKLDQAGIKLWVTVLGRHGELDERHADLVDDGRREEWLAALAELEPTGHRKNKSGRSIRSLKLHAWNERVPSSSSE